MVVEILPFAVQFAGVGALFQWAGAEIDKQAGLFGSLIALGFGLSGLFLVALGGAALIKALYFELSDQQFYLAMVMTALANGAVLAIWGAWDHKDLE